MTCHTEKFKSVFSIHYVNTANSRDKIETKIKDETKLYQKNFRDEIEI